jgi:hypothetical protein
LGRKIKKILNSEMDFNGEIRKIKEYNAKYQGMKVKR